MPHPHVWLIRLIGVVVPRALRADWRLEWEAELAHREARLRQWDRLDWRAQLRLLRESTAALWDALSLQPRRLEDEVIQDVRYALRSIWAARMSALAAIVSLAVGVGANTAIFTVVNAVISATDHTEDTDTCSGVSVYIPA